MSNSKTFPPFIFDTLYYLNRDQLERLSIVCHPLKNFIGRYFHSKPCRIFDRLEIRSGSYALVHNLVQWHPNRDDYSVKQFLAGQKCNIDHAGSYTYYSFAKMRPYLGPTVRVKGTSIHVAGGFVYNVEHITEMESIAYLWRDGRIQICNGNGYGRQIVVGDFQPILDSPNILQCRELYMNNAHFSFKDYKSLYTAKLIVNWFFGKEFDFNRWAEFVEKPGVKPLVVLRDSRRESITDILDRLCKSFLSAVSPNTFKMLFTCYGDPLTEFRETNKTSGEKLELKKGVPLEYRYFVYLSDLNDVYSYTLERTRP